MLQDLHTDAPPDEGHKSRTKRVVVATIAAAVSLFVVGYVDIASGRVSVFLFYLVPVCIAALWIGLRGGIIASFVAAAVRSPISLMEHHVSVQTFVWDSIMRLGVFLLVAVLISLIQRYREELNKLRNSLPW